MTTPENRNHDRDALSGLLNQAAFHREIEHSIQFTQYEGIPLSLIYVDVDNFKPVNDIYGLEVGDWLVRSTAYIITHSIRSHQQNPQHERRLHSGTDIIAMGRVAPIFPDSASYRVGGDEFGIIAPANAYGTKIILRRILELYNRFVDSPEDFIRAMDDPEFEMPPRPVNLSSLQVGLSVGTATYEPGMDSSTLKRTADVNLTRAKEQKYRRQLAQYTPEEQGEMWDDVTRLQAKRASRGLISFMMDQLDRER